MQVVVVRSLSRGQSAINGVFRDETSVLSAPRGLCLRLIRLQVPPRAPPGYRLTESSLRARESFLLKGYAAAGFTTRGLN
jgi:hypothetical protein